MDKLQEKLEEHLAAGSEESAARDEMLEAKVDRVLALLEAAKRAKPASDGWPEG